MAAQVASRSQSMRGYSHSSQPAGGGDLAILSAETYVDPNLQPFLSSSPTTKKTQTASPPNNVSQTTEGGSRKRLKRASPEDGDHDREEDEKKRSRGRPRLDIKDETAADVSLVVIFFFSFFYFLFYSIFLADFPHLPLLTCPSHLSSNMMISAPTDPNPPRPAGVPQSQGKCHPDPREKSPRAQGHQ